MTIPANACVLFPQIGVRRGGSRGRTNHPATTTRLGSSMRSCRVDYCGPGRPGPPRRGVPGLPASEVPALASAPTNVPRPRGVRPAITTQGSYVRKDLFDGSSPTASSTSPTSNDRKVEIIWDEEDLFDLLCRRLRENASFVEAIGLPTDASNDEISTAVFPWPGRSGQAGDRPRGMDARARARMATPIMPPRNLIGPRKKRRRR